MYEEKKQNPNIEVQIKTRQSKIIGKIGVIHALWQEEVCLCGK